MLDKIRARSMDIMSVPFTLDALILMIKLIMIGFPCFFLVYRWTDVISPCR